MEAHKKRILHVGKFYPPVRGGMESFLEALATTLAESDTINAVLVHEFKPSRQRAGDPHARKEGDGNPAVFRAPIVGTWIHTPVSPRFPFWLKRICRTFDPDIVHVQMPNLSGIWAVAIACTRHRPLVLHWQADVDDPQYGPALRLLYRLYRPLEQYLLKRASCVIVSSQAYLDGSRSLSRWREKCRIVPLGIDPRRIPVPSDHDRTRAAEIWGRFAHRVLFVGRLTFYKGVDHLVEAARDLPDVRVVIVGSGKNTAGIERLVTLHGLQDRVILAGACSDALRSALLESCTCFCLPSISRAESFGIVSLEAMAFEKPVIVADVPYSGIGSVVDHERTGFRVKVASPADLAHAISQLTSDPERTRRMGKAGRLRLMRLFTIQTVVEQVKDVYHQVTAAPSPAS